MPSRIEVLESRCRAATARSRACPSGPEMLARKKFGTNDSTGQPAVAIVGRHEDRVPLGELRHHRERLGRQRHAEQQMAVVALHHVLRLAHAGGGIAGGILDMQLDRPAEQAALGVLRLAQNSAPRRICWPIVPSGPVSASGMPILIGRSRRARAEDGGRGDGGRSREADLEHGPSRRAELSGHVLSLPCGLIRLVLVLPSSSSSSPLGGEVG